MRTTMMYAIRVTVFARDGRHILIAVHERYQERVETSSWTDTIVLIHEQGRWVVSDIRMGCDWPFRMGPSLREMLRVDSR